MWGCMQIMLPESFVAVSEPPNRPETSQPDHSPGLAERSSGLNSETPPLGPPSVVAAGDLALRVCSCGQGRAAVAGLCMTCYGGGGIRRVSSEATGIPLSIATAGLAAAAIPNTI